MESHIGLVLLWEIAYLVGGLLTYRKLQSIKWLKCALLCWGIVCPLLLCSSFIWAGIRIHDGFSGLFYGFRYFMGLQHLFANSRWLYKNKFDKI